MTTKALENGTRQRILQSAGEVFAEQGFARATVREICRRAGVANLAAIGYHFGDKERLYEEVLRVAHRATKGESFLESGLPVGSPEERLKGFVKELIVHLFRADRQAWQDQLIVREWAEPTEALAALIDEYVRPRYELLVGIVRDLLPASATPITVKRCANSVVSQCIHYHQARFIFSRLTPEQSFDPEGLRELAEHISSFSLAALKCLPHPEGEESGT